MKLRPTIELGVLLQMRVSRCRGICANLSKKTRDFPPPFQGEGRGGDGVDCVISCSYQKQPHPHPSLPLEGEGTIGSKLSLMPCKAGYTLVEIAVVMLIIGMVMLLVLPRLPSSDQENLKISARTLASTMRYMQERVAPTGAHYELAVAPGTESLKVVEIGGDGTVKEPSDPLLQKSPLKEGVSVADLRIPSLGKLVDGQVRVAVGADFVTIHLRSQDGKFWTVMAFPPRGGKVKTYEGYLENPP